MSLIIAIDPGITGGVAYRFPGILSAVNMPSTPKDILDLLKRIVGYDNEKIICYLERVGTYMPGNSGPSAATFARHCGNLEMALWALNIPYHEVLPNKWMTAFIGKQDYPKIPKETSKKTKASILSKRKTERKNKIKAKCQALYPHLKVTLKTADALGILSYALMQESVNNR